MNATKLIAVLAMVTWGSLALAAGTAEERRDRATYNGLLGELNGARAEYGGALRAAVREARANGGKASLEAQSRVLAARNRADRAHERLTLLALRHGWEIPEVNLSSGTAQPVQTEDQRIFQPARRLIVEQFAEDARRIAAAVRLPVLSFSKTKGKGVRR